nr:MAG TPA: hypothetical protein [Caudoviricetes sp.]
MTSHPKRKRHSRNLSAPCQCRTNPDRSGRMGQYSPVVRLGCRLCRYPKNHPFY